MTERGPRLWILAVGIVFLLPLVYVLWTGFGKDPKAVPDAMTGETAPRWELVTLDGEPLSLDDLEGFPVVLNFWSTWCVPCKVEHPVLQAAEAEYGPRGVVFLGVLYGDEPSKARAFLQKQGNAYPTLVDLEGRTAVDYGVAGVPETFFIGKDGQIVKKVSGAVTMLVMVETLEGML